MYKFKRVEDKKIRIKQANIFYNYSICFESFDVNLIQLAGKLLKEGFTEAVCFSDFKFLYLDSESEISLGVPEINDKDGRWDITLEEDIPKNVAQKVFSSLEIAFFENKAGKSQPHYLVANLPPIVLALFEYELKLFPSVKIFADGIAVLSFQFDATWEGISEDDFINRFLNLTNYNFDDIWIDRRLQKMDAELSLLNAFDNELSIAGTSISSRAINRLKKQLKSDTEKVVKNALNKEGRNFDFNGQNLILHSLAGSDTCDHRSFAGSLAIDIYIGAIQSIVNPKNAKTTPIYWSGRPSVSLLRFDKQPEEKRNFVEKHSKFLSKIMLRSAASTTTLKGVEDLRLMDDYCLLANRAVLLWCWTKTRHEAENAWSDEYTRARVLENQARAQFVEYCSARIVRACHWAQNPVSKVHLLYAYKNLGELNVSIRNSSHSGEIIDSIISIMEASGIPDMIEPSKELAKFHLDELKYNAQTKVSRQATLLTMIFGFVGTTSLAEFAFSPLIRYLYPSFAKFEVACISLLGAGSFVGITIFIIWHLFKWTSNSR
ncbi:hypothetical protein [Alteromonas gilva]|uniref:SMODS-associated and fused to various effectors domain-containing protein n=1 Tax=Alteromonas gilva TaxID=2987522 RepID=A0ABT5L5S9_9ALTE|nr:hypothetical protein [Alteromonas gilva]MDC8832228.1 hypothetical protein [Alteromonas gilva]